MEAFNRHVKGWVVNRIYTKELGNSIEFTAWKFLTVSVLTILLFLFFGTHQTWLIYARPFEISYTYGGGGGGGGNLIFVYVPVKKAKIHIHKN